MSIHLNYSSRAFITFQMRACIHGSAFTSASASSVSAVNDFQPFCDVACVSKCMCPCTHSQPMQMQSENLCGNKFSMMNACANETNVIATNSDLLYIYIFYLADDNNGHNSSTGSSSNRNVMQLLLSLEICLWS